MRVFHEQQFGYSTVEIDGDNVTCIWHHRVDTNAYQATSEVFSYSIPPPQPVLQFEYRGGNWTLSWPGPAVLQSATNLDGNFADLPGFSSPYALTNLNGPSRYCRLRVVTP